MSQDRPDHVRAASGIVRVGGRVAVIQDDANFVALVDPATGVAEPIALPAGHLGKRQFDDARGTKRFKLDLEACAAVVNEGEELLLTLGSGSGPLRENAVLVRGIGRGAPAVELVHAPALYERLRRARGFAGSEMNVEGATVVGRALRLFGRGNGAARDGLRPVNATCDLDLRSLLLYLRNPAENPTPAPESVVRYELGDIDGLPLGFTDAAVLGARLCYVAAAEDSPDALQDGPVVGSAFGVIGGEARWTEIEDVDGSRYLGKVEGLLMLDARSALVVVDRDDPARPSELCELEIAGIDVG